MQPILIIAGAIVIFLFLFMIRVLQEFERGVVFFLGRNVGVRGPGLILLFPILEQMFPDIWLP